MENFDMITCFWAMMNQSKTLILPIVAIYILMDLLGSILFKK